MATEPDSTNPPSPQSQNRADDQREAKHTPMEWAYDEDDARIYYDDGNVQPTIAYVEREGVAPEQVKADGYLLATAPQLLKACRTLADDCRMALSGEWDKGDEGFQSSLELLESVIAKATGGAP